MAARGKFVLNKRTIGHIAKKDDGLIAAVDDAAAEIAGKAGPTATVDTYTTDLHVAGVTVSGAAQARDGVATRAAQSVAADNAGNAAGRERLEGGIKSRAQWRYLAAMDRGALRQYARSSPRYSSLPERVNRDG